MYARAFLEGRLSAQQLENFRRELKPGGGLSSYPHPWLMPDFWEYPTVSMGLSPLMAIYQARYNRYLEDRGLKPVTDAKVWAFLGDGETDEPESLGAITLASREKLDNLIFVINCNLQRLDGPVRGNGQIIQELESAFRGARWNVIKVFWGSEWDPILDRDTEGLLVKRMGELVDGEYQKLVVESGAYVRQHFFGSDPRLLQLVEPFPTTRCAACVSAATTRAKFMPPTKLPWSTRARRRSFWRAPLKVTAWAKPAKARTSPTSRKNSTRTSCAFSARVSPSRSDRRRLHRSTFLSSAGGQPRNPIPARSP